MQDQFSPASVKIMLQAQEEARQLRQNEVDTGEILVAILAVEESSMAQQVLFSYDVSLERARQSLERVRGKGISKMSGSVPLTFHGKRLCETAREIASETGQLSIAPEHMLLSILKTEQFAAQEVLSDLAINPADLRISIYAAIGAGKTISKPGISGPNEIIAALAAERTRLAQKVEYQRRKTNRLEQEISKQKAFLQKVRTLLSELDT